MTGSGGGGRSPQGPRWCRTTGSTSRREYCAPNFSAIETLVADASAGAIAFMVTRPRRAAVNNLWIGPTAQI
jgi:NADP-dependent 3-hydroxy acid dehydrogenase YdfG